MGLQTIPTRSDPSVFTATWVNIFKQALAGIFCGRDETTGAPAAGKDLGTPLFPWGTLYCGGIAVDGALLDLTLLSAETHKVVSGKTRSTSNQPAFLTPAGAAGGPAFGVKGATTPLVIEVSGEQGTIDTDITVSGLSLAPSSNNTCLLNDSSATSQEATRTWGEPEDGTDLTVDTMGSGISALVGTYQAFKVVNGANTEYFIAYVDSTTKLKNAFRGYFFNSSLAPVNRIKLADNNVITLMKLHWVFADIDGTTIATTATAPKIDATEPASPTTGDYWYDLGNSLWKRYDGAAFQTVDRTLIGCVITDTADCVAARCFDFFAGYSPVTGVDLERTSNSVVQSRRMRQKISVAGRLINFRNARVYWDMATDLAASADLYDSTEQASRTYYFYIKDTGQEVISDVSPYFRGDLYGWYHPHNPWRCVGSCPNDGSSNLSTDEGALLNFGALGPRVVSKRALSPVSVQVTQTAMSTASTTFASVGGSVVVQSTGRPVFVLVQPKHSQGSALQLGITNNGGAARTDLQFTIRLLRNSVEIAQWLVGSPGASFAVFGQHFVPNMFFFDRTAPAGSNTYQWEAKVANASIQFSGTNVEVDAFET